MVSVFKKKQKNPLILRASIAGGVVLLVCLLVAIADIRVWQKKKKLLSQVEILESQIQRLQEKNANLKEGILKAEDPDYIEKIAREELDLQKPGEKVVSFVVGQDQENSPEAGLNKGILNNFLGWLSNSWRGFLKK